MFAYLYRNGWEAVSSRIRVQREGCPPCVMRLHIRQ